MSNILTGMHHIWNLLLDVFGPKDWTGDLRNKRTYRRRNGRWEYRPMTDEELNESYWMWLIK